MNKRFLTLLSFVLVLSGCVPASEAPAPVTTTPKSTTINSNPLQDKPLPTASFQTKLKLTADKTSVEVGDMVVVSIFVSGAQEGVTTFDTEMTFNPGLLLAEKIDTKDSVFPLAFKEEMDNKKGTVRISRSHSTGVTGDDNLLGKVTFTVMSSAKPWVKLNPDATMVLLKNNANVTPDVADFPSLEITVGK